MAYDYSPYWEGTFFGSREAYCLRCRRPRYDLYADQCWVCDTPLISLATAKRLTEQEAKTIESELISMAATNVLVDRDAASYLNECVMACPGEVGGLGYVKRLEDGDLWVYEFCLIEQEATSGGVEFDDKAMALFLERQAEREDFENLRCSWHSHGSMSTFFSSTDTDDAIEKYKGSGVPWLLSLVLNRKGDVSTRLDVFDSSAIDHLWLEDLTYQVVAPAGIAERAKADVKALVSRPKPSTVSKVKPKGKPDSDGATTVVIEGGRRQEYRDGKLVSDKPLGEERLSRKQRKKLRREREQQLVDSSDLTMKEVKRLSNDELEELIDYQRELTEKALGSHIHQMTDKEWLAFCDANGVKLDDSTRALLSEKPKENDDDWGGIA